MKQELTDATALPLMAASFRTTESCGLDRHYEMVFRFAPLADLVAADGEWHQFQRQEAALMDAKDAEIAALTKQNNAYKALTESMEGRMLTLRALQADFKEAVNTLASERQANALLTDEIAALRQKADNYDWLIEGKRSKRIWNHVLYDFETEGKGSLQEVIDAGIKAMAQAVQPS